jgi:DNA-binding NarL/FixJ family response regulator
MTGSIPESSARQDPSWGGCPMRHELIIADDHPLYRAALRGAVAAACEGAVFLETGNVAGLFDLIEQHERADLLLLDLNMPGAHGFSALAHLRGLRPGLPIIMVSATDDARTVRQAMALGAQGFISKSADVAAIGQSVLAALRGDIVLPPDLRPDHQAPSDAGAVEVARRIAELTPQQFRVLSMLCSGMLNKQIAHELQISEATVKAHMTVVLRKLGATNRTQAVLLAGRLAVDPHDVRVPGDEAD